MRLINHTEIENSSLLQKIYWIFIFGFGFSLNSMRNLASNASNKIESFQQVCPPYFQTCSNLSLPATLPESWGNNILYACLGFLVFLSAYFFYKREYKRSLLALSIPTIFQFLASILFSIHTSIPFEFFHTGLILVFIFFPNKLDNLRLTFVVLYFCAGLMKLDSSWIGGAFFSSLELGLPLVPRSLIPFATNIVIIFELFFIFFLLGKNSKIRSLTFKFFIFFHLYSIILVGMRYPYHCLFIFYLLFNNSEKNTFPAPTEQKRVLFFLLYPIVILIFNLIALGYGESAKITYKGFHPSLNMFDANRVCIINFTKTLRNGTSNNYEFIHHDSYQRCNLYENFYRLKSECNRNKEIDSIHLSFRAAINGGPILKYVDHVNICQVSFSAYSQDSWIAGDSDLQKQLNSANIEYPGLSDRIRSHKPLTRHSKPQRHPLVSDKIVENLKMIYIIIAMLSLLIFGKRYYSAYKEA